jgi:hypothetical protein
MSQGLLASIMANECHVVRYGVLRRCKRDRITHSGVVDHRIAIPRHSYSHDPREAQEVALAHSSYPPFGPSGNYPLDGDNRLQSTHSPHDDKVQGKTPSTTPIEQSNRPNTATGVPSDSPWGLTKAGRARKRLEQACVSCRKKKTKCERAEWVN